MANEAKKLNVKKLTLATFLLVAAGIAAAGVVYELLQKNHLREVKLGEVNAIADLKVKNLVSWREEQETTVQALVRNRFAARAVREWLSGPATPRLRSDLELWLERFGETFRYRKVVLLDAEGKVSLSWPRGSSLDADTLKEVTASPAESQSRFTRFHRTGQNQIALEVFRRIPDPDNAARQSIGYIVAEIDPSRFLYPYIQRWPVPSSSAETLLVERQDDQVVFLNELRHRQGTPPLTIRLPLSNRQLPAARAAMGETGVFEGVDYRGVEVLAAYRPIPGSPWGLVSKVDEDEVYDPLWRTSSLVLGILSALIALAGAAFFLVSRENAQRAAAEVELKRQNEELQNAQEQLESRNRELQSARDRERLTDWVKSGLNELNVIVRGDKPVATVTEEALRFMAGYLKAGVGILYLFEEESQTLRIAAHYAFPRGKDLNETIRLGEGAAGEAAREKRAVTLGNVPPGYLAIGSALGEAEPRSLLALPLLHDERLVGVMELGKFDEFNSIELEFLGKAAEVLAIAVSVNHTRQRANELLLQSQSQAEELRVQQEELQQSNEELEERAELLEQQREQIQIKNREIEESAREVGRKAKEIEQISTYKSEFLANMSHELRTPLNSLMILSGQLKENREGNLTGKQVEYAATIQSAGNDLLNLINDILDLSKIEAGRMQFALLDTRLGDLCGEIERTFKPMADEKGLQFTTAIDEGAAREMKLDPQRTLQVLKNLLSNAIKFTEKGSVRLRIYQPEREKNPLPVPSMAFAVIDTGIGIPADKHELVFQAFMQADGSTSRKFGGTGLGLSISRELAKGMNGAVLLAAAEGEGSVFTLYLPLSPSRMEEDFAGQKAFAPGISPVPQPVPASRPAPAADSAPIADDRDRIAAGERSILIIEDDRAFAKVLMERVRERGFAAVVAADGNSGIELAEKLLPTAILLDVMLPGQDGWAVMQKMNDNVRIRHIPVHFITCLEERQKALSMGAIGFVTKPVTTEQLDSVFRTIQETVSRAVRKLLIVEDDAIQSAALLALLEGRDISIRVVETGKRAIEVLLAEQYDCIVLDLGLADMSGFELLEHIRGLDENRRIPVIIHTGRELSLQETQRLQQYAESIIIKGAKSPERLLNEVTLFLHVMESRLPPEKQRMIRKALDRESLLADKKVLVVDDDMRNVFALSGALADVGMRVVAADNGKAALAMLEKHPDVNVVLMDVMMPEMDGYEATRLIRHDPRFARLPVIALTAKAMKGDREACLRAGASDYITKPVDMERLLSLLRVWLYHNA